MRILKLKITIALSLLILLIILTPDNAVAQNNIQIVKWNNLPHIDQPVFPKDTFNIKDYGAKSDGGGLNTQSINEAIESCSKSGGGVVVIPSGYWLTGPLELMSNVNLHLEENSFLQFSSDFDQYKLVKGIYEGLPAARNQSPIFGRNLKNIAITGKGIIDGNGDAWRMVTKAAMTNRQWQKRIISGGILSEDGKTWYPSEKVRLAHIEKRTFVISKGQSLSDFEDIKDYLRPNLLVLENCEKILLEGITFQNSPAWNLHPLMSRHITIQGVTIKNPTYAQNGDGIDVESCAYVLIESCTLDVGDDAICLKSGKNEAGRKRDIPTEKVIIRNNKVYAGHGGFVVGSEMSGGVHDVFVENCIFMGTDKGLRFKTTRGRGGIVENIFIRNVSMFNIDQEAILFNMYYWTTRADIEEVQPIPLVTIETPQFKNIFIDHVICSGAAQGILLRGLPEMPIRNISMTNLDLNVDNGIDLIDAQEIVLKNINIKTPSRETLIHIENVSDLSVDSLKYNPEREKLVKINGGRNSRLFFKHSIIKEDQICCEQGSKPETVKIDTSENLF